MWPKPPSEAGSAPPADRNEPSRAAENVLALVEVSLDGPGRDVVRYLRCPYGPDVRLPFDTTATTLAWRPYWERAGSLA